MDEMVEEKQSTVRFTVFVVVGVFFFMGLMAYFSASRIFVLL